MVEGHTDNTPINTEKYESSSLEVKKHIKSLGFNVLINIWPDIIYYRT